MTTVHVSKTAHSSFRSLQDAIHAVETGSRIIIEPGVYEETVVVDKNVEIIGNGSPEQVIIKGDGFICVTLTSDKIRIANLTVMGIGPNNQYGLYTDKGSSTIENCMISSAVSAIGVMNEGTSPTIENCFFHNSQFGIITYFGATFTVIRCTIQDNSMYGIKICETSNPSISETIITSNGTGALVSDNGQGLFEGCLFNQNKIGLAVTNQGAPIVRRSKYTNNVQNIELTGEGVCILHQCEVTSGEIGIRVQENGYLDISDSKLVNNRYYNLLMNHGTIHLHKSTIQNSQTGIAIQGAIQSQINQCEISSNKIAGIVIEGKNDLVIKNCNLLEEACGIFFHQQGSALIENCKIIGSKMAGLSILENSHPRIDHCLIKDGHYVGLHLDHAGGTIQNTKILNHRYKNVLFENVNNTNFIHCDWEQDHANSAHTQLSSLIPVDNNLSRASLNEQENTDQSLPELMNQLHSYIGLKEVKNKITDLIHFLEYIKERKAAGIHSEASISLHSIFLGNPGTGKTTIARLLGKIFYAIGLLEKGQLVEVDRSDLVGQYIGETTKKTEKVVDDAKGGVLFIDEAYTLVKESEKDFGKEALEVILKRMEDEKDFIVIAAGYPTEMENFVNANPGLKDRFTNYFQFEDYNPEELLEILNKLALEEEYSITKDAEDELNKEFIERYRKRDRTFGNARMVKKLFEEMKMNHARNCTKLTMEEKTKEALTTITVNEVQPLLTKNSRKELSFRFPINQDKLAELLAELHSLVGLDNLKQEVSEMIKLINYYNEEGESLGDMLFPHTVFVGNPGTGKTTVARLLSEIYKSIGILPKGHLIETSRENLVAGHVGQTSIKTANIIEAAAGGTLFIDEAYTLAKNGITNDFGQEAIETLLKRMEDDRGKFILIVAGYTEQMMDFLRSNPGLQSRFGRIIEFEDYNPEDLLEITKRLAAQEQFVIEAEALEALYKHYLEVYENRDQTFSNARYVRNLMDHAIRQATLRLADMSREERQGKKLITVADLF